MRLDYQRHLLMGKRCTAVRLSLHCHSSCCLQLHLPAVTCVPVKLVATAAFPA
jgi:hypothetical protein